MIKYYCSGYDIEDAFGHGIGDMFQNEINNTKCIVFIPGGEEKIEKAKVKHIPLFRKYFNNVNIKFDEEILITPDMDSKEAQKAIKKADFIMLMGGDPFKQKVICEKLNIIDDLKSFDGIMMGFSAGAMLMSKYIIITPCSEEYPDFHIEEGLNLDNISIYPHNNTNEEVYPNKLVVGNEVYKKQDLIKVAQEFGNFFLIQDYIRDDNKMDISLIKSDNGKLELYTENDGKIWLASDTIELIDNNYFDNLSNKKIK